MGPLSRGTVGKPPTNLSGPAAIARPGRTFRLVFARRVRLVANNQPFTPPIVRPEVMRPRNA